MVGVSKRVFDILISLILLIISFPFLIMVGFLVLIFSGSPIIFKNTRLAKGGKPFTIYKFRTMVPHDNRKKDGLSEKDLITPIGHFLRNTHFDETLQLWNVLIGDMTLIGPRAMDEQRFKYLYAKDKKWKKILNYVPGITGLNQLCRYYPPISKKILKNLNLDKRNRLYLDLYYIKNQSFGLDIKITLWTITYLFKEFFKQSGLRVNKFVHVIFFGLFKR